MGLPYFHEIQVGEISFHLANEKKIFPKDQIKHTDQTEGFAEPVWPCLGCLRVLQNSERPFPTEGGYFSDAFWVVRIDLSPIFQVNQPLVFWWAEIQQPGKPRISYHFF